MLKALAQITEIPLRNSRSISISAVRSIDQKWRAEKGLPENPNAFGPLTNAPDYTYLDGRPTPLGANQKRRIQKQQEIAAKILQYNEELQYAKDRHARIQADEKAKNEAILKSKLKPKGHLLLKKD